MIHLLNHYTERRRKIYTTIREEGVFTWDTIEGVEYALATIHYICPEFLQELREATERLGEIFAKTALILQSSSNDLLGELGIPPAAWSAVRQSFIEHWSTVIGRFDFASTPDGIKMLEFNSDTPTGVVEAFYVNGKVCEFFGAVDPNEGTCNDLRKAFSVAVDWYRRQGFPTERIVFSSLGWHKEDAGTARFLLEKSGLPGRFVPLDELFVKGDSLWVKGEGDENYEPIDVWYRLHPIEILAEDCDDQGYPTGKHLLELMALRKIAVINPPKALLSQTKAMQALVWNLAESGEFYTKEEQEAIRRWMLPTYIENPFIGVCSYVQKPIFGREGGAVTLFDDQKRVIAQMSDPEYEDQPMVYQQMVDLEVIDIETLKGLYTGKILWGSFLVGGKASAIVARVDKEITGNDSYFLPIGLA